MNFIVILIVGLIIGGVIYTQSSPETQEKVKQKISQTVEDLTVTNQTEEFNQNISSSNNTQSVNVPYDVPDEFNLNGVPYIRKDQCPVGG